MHYALSLPFADTGGVPFECEDQQLLTTMVLSRSQLIGNRIFDTFYVYLWKFK